MDIREFLGGNVLSRMDKKLPLAIGDCRCVSDAALLGIEKSKLEFGVSITGVFVRFGSMRVLKRECRLRSSLGGWHACCL